MRHIPCPKTSNKKKTQTENKPHAITHTLSQNTAAPCGRLSPLYKLARLSPCVLHAWPQCDHLYNADVHSRLQRATRNCGEWEHDTGQNLLSNFRQFISAKKTKKTLEDTPVEIQMWGFFWCLAPQRSVSKADAFLALPRCNFRRSSKTGRLLIKRPTHMASLPAGCSLSFGKIRTQRSRLGTTQSDGLCWE